MRKLTILVLTDHRVHKKHNPVYALLPALLNHPACSNVHIASRGNPQNEAFFEKCQDVPIWVQEVKDDFGYTEDGIFFLQNQAQAELSSFDAVLMRMARPLPDIFLHFLATFSKRVAFVNDPTGIITTGNKAYLLNFPKLCPPTQLCKSIVEIQRFAAQFPIVLKPLREYGGRGIVRLEGDLTYHGDKVLPTTSFLKQQEDFIHTEGYLAMKFLKNVHQGDKRLLVAGGEILSAALRLPAPGSWLCNVAQGGRSAAARPTSEEEQLVAQLSPPLAKEGILIYGADTLVDDSGKRVLSEINTMSVGGFQAAQELTSEPIVEQTIEKIIQYVYQFHSK